MLTSYKKTLPPRPYSEQIGGICKQAAQARESRKQRDLLDEEVAHYFYPERKGFTSDVQKGQNYQDEVFTSGPQIARRQLGISIGALMRPAGQLWFRAGAEDEELSFDPDTRTWLDIVTRITYSALYDRRSQFEASAAEADHDVPSFGRGVLYHDIVDTKMGAHLIFQCIHPKDVFFRKNHLGVVDTAFRYREMTIPQIEAAFGEEALTRKMRDELRKQKPNLEKKWVILHAVIPNEHHSYYGFGPGRLPFASLWVSEADKELISEGGYYHFPYIVATWDSVTGEAEGRGPGHIALNDARVADAIAQTLLDAGEKAANPPLTAPADMIRGEIELIPGGLTLYDASGFQFQGPPVVPIDLGKNMPLTLELLQGYEGRISQAFYRDVLDMPQFAPRTTAAQVNAEMQDFLRTAAPVFSRLDATYNSRILDSVFMLLQREGAYPPPPDALRGRNVRFEYEGPVRQAERKARAMRNLEAAQALLPLSEVFQEIAENIDPDMLARTTWANMGADEMILRHPDAIAETRQQRMQAQQMQMMAEMANKAAPALKAGADTAFGAQDRQMLPPPEDVIDAVSEEVSEEDLAGMAEGLGL